jgi:AcrR family transcriptional regulator
VRTATPDPQRLTPKGERTRLRIVDAAAELIFTKGVANTTIEHVRGAAEVSSSQLYHYFQDKHALVEAVIAAQTEAILAGQEAVRPDSLEGLRAWRDFVVETERKRGCRGGCPLGALGSELAETDPSARDAVAAGFRRWEGVLREGLRSMLERGELAPSADPDDLALATLTALQGGLLMAQIQRDTKPLETVLDAMIERITSASTGTAASSLGSGTGTRFATSVTQPAANR